MKSECKECGILNAKLEYALNERNEALSLAEKYYNQIASAKSKTATILHTCRELLRDAEPH